MRKKKWTGAKMALLIGSISLFASCEKEETVIYDTFNTSSEKRDLIVIISDIHLGADKDYAEINLNLESLRAFLEQIRCSRSVKELVIGGDFLDEWFVPASVNTYQGKDQADFVHRIAQTNSEVIDVLNNIIQEGVILVTYVPGNHDLAITGENIESILPGIHQVRDADAKGLGTYSPTAFPELVVEHGHRYNIFCAPDPISNQDIAPGCILPAGYFLTRLVVQHVLQECTQNIDSIPKVTINISSDESQILLYAYWSGWAKWLTAYPINNHFDEKLIITHIDGFSDTLTVKDLLPYQESSEAPIQVKLYRNMPDTWALRCERNHVAVAFSARDAFKYAAIVSGTDTMAVIQYFNNPNAAKRLVVFGHTHSARIKTYQNGLGQKCVYANTGTWIDHNTIGGTTMTFVIISPQSENESSQTHVNLYHFENKIVTQMAEDSLRL
jgi:UDP-2,3-diacylglucosamine pyrophosphatase LpxH